MKSYYLGQKIQYFKGGSYTLEQNWEAAFQFAADAMKWAVENNVALFSPAALTIPLAREWNTTESAKSREMYMKIDKQMIERLRAAGELIWVMPADWYESAGCRIEVKDAIAHDEKVIRYGSFVSSLKEVDIFSDITLIKEEFNALSYILLEVTLEKRKGEVKHADN